MAAGAFLAICLVLFSVLIWYLKTNRVRKLVNKIPGPPALPILGNALEFKPGGADFYKQVMEYADRYNEKGIFRLWLGVRPMLCAYTADNIEHLLNSSKHMEKAWEYQFLHPWLGTGLLTSTGDKWRSRRKLLTPTFHFRILQDFQQVFNEQSKVMVSKLDKMAGQGTFDIFNHITLCALDIICETAMGKTVNAQDDSNSEYVKAIYRISDIVMNRMKAPWYWVDFMFYAIGNGREHDKLLATLHDFTIKVIEERKKSFEEQYANQSGKPSFSEIGDDMSGFMIGKRKRLAFLDMLLHASMSEQQLSNEDIREEVDTFMFEGHDTTAAAANWAVHLIGSHPEVQHKVQQELDRVFGDSDRPVATEDLKELQYLECVIKEALRLYPSVPMFGRTLSEDAKVAGYIVPKGTTSLIITSALHRDPKYFPDPEKFDPDRWLDGSTERHPYSYVPFSAGLRNCIGQKFAMNEEKVLLSAIFRNFNVESMQTPEELYPTGEIILRPMNGVKVKLTRREI